MLDITEVLSKSLCLEQIGFVTVLHLETLNNRLYAALNELGDTPIRQNRKFRFGTQLKKHARDLAQSQPTFHNIIISRRPAKQRRDFFSSIRSLQTKACEFLRSAMKERLALDVYSKACQVLLPHKKQTDPNFEVTLEDNLSIIIEANIGFVGGEKHRSNIERGLRKLIKIFDRREFKDFTDLEVLDAYMVIWSSGQFYKELGLIPSLFKNVSW